MRKFTRDIPISIYPPIFYYNSSYNTNVWEKINDKRKNLYIHIPFCPQKCKFCYFTSYGFDLDLVERYVCVLCDELKFITQKSCQKPKIDNIYIGGGTPTLLPLEMLEKIFTTINTYYSVSEDAEITVEVRPGNEVNKNKLEYLKKVGVNRISTGVQSFSSDILRLNGRNNNIDDVYRLLSLINETEFNCLNIDIMSGMLGENKTSWNYTIEKLLEILPENITLYKMQLYANSLLYGDSKKHKIEIMSEDRELHMAKFMYMKLIENGYCLDDSTYSFKLKKYIKNNSYRKSRNMGTEIIAVGVSANGYVNDYVYQNSNSIEDYLHESSGSHISSSYKLCDEEKFYREIILNLKSGQIDRKEIMKKYYCDPYYKFKEKIDELVKMNLVELSHNKIVVINEGILFIDDIIRRYFMQDFIRTKEAMLLKFKNFKFREV